MFFSGGTGVEGREFLTDISSSQSSCVHVQNRTWQNMQKFQSTGAGMG